MTLLKTITALSPLALALASCGASAPGDNAAGAPTNTSALPFTLTDIAVFDQPWALTPDPQSDRLFVTERAGRIRIVLANGTLGTVSGVPAVDFGGQGGLGDFVFLPSPRSSPATGPQTVFLSWVEAGPSNTRGAVVGKAQLVCAQPANCALQRLTVIWRTQSHRARAFLAPLRGCARWRIAVHRLG